MKKITLALCLIFLFSSSKTILATKNIEQKNDEVSSKTDISSNHDGEITTTFEVIEEEISIIDFSSESIDNEQEIINHDKLIGLSYRLPQEDPSIIRGPKIPKKDKWNVWKEDVSINGGDSSGGPLYSNYRMYGKGTTKSTGKRKGKYYISLTNNGENDVRVMAKREEKTYLDYTIAPGKSVTKSFDNIYTTTEWYLRLSNTKGKHFSVKGTIY